jgi:hypothetical protein
LFWANWIGISAFVGRIENVRNTIPRAVVIFIGRPLLSDGLQPRAGLIAGVYRIRVSDQNTDKVFLALLASRFASGNFFQTRTFVAGILPISPTVAFSPLLRAALRISKCAGRGKNPDDSHIT